MQFDRFSDTFRYISAPKTFGRLRLLTAIIATESKVFTHDQHFLISGHRLIEEAEELLLAGFAPRVKFRFGRAMPPSTEFAGIFGFLCHAEILRRGRASAPFLLYSHSVERHFQKPRILYRQNEIG